MTSITKTLLLFSLTCFFSSSIAAETDTLWNKSLSQYKAANLWIPKEMRTQLDTERKDQPTKTDYIKSSLSGWEKQDPTYTNISTDNNWQALSDQKKTADGINKLLMALDEMKSSLFDGEIKPKQLANETIDGKNLAVFQLSDGGMGRKVSVKLWIIPDTACMVKMNTSIHVALYADADFSTRYTEPNKQGLCLHSQMQGSIDMQIPFKKAKIHIKQSNSDWTLKPAN
ncbi:MAG: hypothetical protein HY254_18540 [Burkholderiales bacterium]|nr:hypothetical protein [Burkholderiales bacterium]